MLVDRCLDGEQAAARELFRRQRGRVQASLYRILGSNRDMDDLLQETFIQVFRSLGSFRGESRLATWIDRIAVRAAYRHLSRSRNQLTPVPLDIVDASASGDVPGVGAEPAGRRAEPFGQTVAREGVRRLYAALAQLPAKGRIAFALHAIDGRPVAEVARLVAASETATKLRIWRARRALERIAADDPILREFLREDAG
ncbi:MAG: RNA polymerase sigma factor [Myxococcota bacterium]